MAGEPFLFLATEKGFLRCINPDFAIFLVVKNQPASICVGKNGESLAVK